MQTISPESTIGVQAVQHPFAAMVRACRPHQWVKNTLLFVPLVTSHQLLDPGMLWTEILAFAAFSLCSSSVYILNDILDIRHDRVHPQKRHRPFASGALSPRTGVAMALVLLMGSASLALSLLPTICLALLGLYYVVANLYSTVLKRMSVLDVLTLAGLYTLRILFGAAAVGVIISNWLLAFSMFLFLSLAFLKRYAELSLVRDMDGVDAPGREYSVNDMELIRSLGSVSGYLSVLVLALYIHSSTDVVALYRNPSVLWLIGPCLLYWITRIWLLAHRGKLQQDPLLFTVRDPASYAVGAVVAVVLLGATL